MVLWQMSEIIDDKVWEINPYNGSAFGGLIVVLCLIVYYFMNQLSKNDEIIRQKD